MKFINRQNIYTALISSGLCLTTVALSSVALNQRKETISYNSQGEVLTVNSRKSLVHLGSIDSFDRTEGGIQAGKYMLQALKNKDLDAARKAIDLYDVLIPKENYGGEYTALQWFAQYLLATDGQKKEFFADKSAKEFFAFWEENDFAKLKEYIERKYKLVEYNTDEENQARETFLEDMILFNNPRREEWEGTSKILEIMNIQPGTHIADIGSGPGYYSFRLAELVGDKGKVYAIDTVQSHLDYIKQISDKYDINNIELVKLDKTDNIGLPPDQVDVAYMCSLYHIIYTTSMEEVKDRYINSIKSALKPGGKFVVVDNALVTDDEIPYHGPFIAKELIIAQLEYYGFRLVEQHQFIPQRYILIFELEEG